MQCYYHSIIVVLVVVTSLADFSRKSLVNMLAIMSDRLVSNALCALTVPSSSSNTTSAQHRRSSQLVIIIIIIILIII